MKGLVRILIFIIIVFPKMSWAADYVGDHDWVVYSESLILKQKVLYKKIDGQPVNAVKVEAMLDAKMVTLLMLLSAPDLYLQWVPVLSEFELIQSADKAGVSYSYMVSELPWPVKNRDATMKTLTTFNKESGTVVIESEVVSGQKPKVAGLVRVPLAYNKWTITPISENSQKLEIVWHSDPGGKLPKWLLNMFVTQVPKRSFSNIRKMAADPRVINVPFNEKLVFGRDLPNFPKP